MSPGPRSGHHSGIRPGADQPAVLLARVARAASPAFTGTPAIEPCDSKLLNPLVVKGGYAGFDLVHPAERDVHLDGTVPTTSTGTARMKENKTGLDADFGAQRRLPACNATARSAGFQPATRWRLLQAGSPGYERLCVVLTATPSYTPQRIDHPLIKGQPIR